MLLPCPCTSVQIPLFLERLNQTKHPPSTRQKICLSSKLCQNICFTTQSIETHSNVKRIYFIQGGPFPVEGLGTEDTHSPTWSGWKSKCLLWFVLLTKDLATLALGCGGLRCESGRWIPHSGFHQLAGHIPFCSVTKPVTLGESVPCRKLVLGASGDLVIASEDASSLFRLLGKSTSS